MTKIFNESFTFPFDNKNHILCRNRVEYSTKRKLKTNFSLWKKNLDVLEFIRWRSSSDCSGLPFKHGNSRQEAQLYFYLPERAKCQRLHWKLWPGVSRSEKKVDSVWQRTCRWLAENPGFGAAWRNLGGLNDHFRQRTDWTREYHEREIQELDHEQVQSWAGYAAFSLFDGSGQDLVVHSGPVKPIFTNTVQRTAEPRNLGNPDKETKSNHNSNKANICWVHMHSCSDFDSENDFLGHLLSSNKWVRTLFVLEYGRILYPPKKTVITW